ncbi:hypothetical protein IE53DRAFT_386900 [Violaceomyces palustris]|uniref:Uncharacterized protein n=1 Tax=Violaceomyces palustris TaxID=1673888 RepID=A0ACD0NY51_9BASI|nr:hypothetical protein IE53DRAFT_386900 [Violaceomyces palustris]
MSTRSLLRLSATLRSTSTVSTSVERTLPLSNRFCCSNLSRQSFSTSCRALASDAVKKPSIKSIGEIRKLMPGTSMLKAREALSVTRSADKPDEDDIRAALAWLEEDRRKTGAKKAEKVSSRSAREGVVAVTVLSDGIPSQIESSDKVQLTQEARRSGLGLTPPAKASIVEVNCETDFVARNEVFEQLVRDIAHTAALFPSLAGGFEKGSSGDGGLVDPRLEEIPVEKLLEFPLLPSSPDAGIAAQQPKTVGSAIIDVVSRLGEKVSVTRASALVGGLTTTTPSADSPRRSQLGTDRGNTILHVASAFAHGSSSGSKASKSGSSGSNNNPGFVSTSGRVASLLLTRIRSVNLPDALSGTPSQPSIQDSTRALVRSLARQTAGMETKSITSSQLEDRPDTSSEEEARQAPSMALYDQEFMMLLPSASPSPESQTKKVKQVLDQWSESKGLSVDGPAVEVIAMKRWELGETSKPEVGKEEAANNFAEEVRRVAGL